MNLSTDHTMLVSRLYCLKKQFTDYRNKKHDGPLRSQLLYYLGHPVVMPHDARLFSEWSGAVEPILLHWYNEAHYINTDGSVGRFLNLDIQVIKQMWDNVIFALQDEHIKENTELAHVLPNIPKILMRYIAKTSEWSSKTTSWGITGCISLPRQQYNKLIILFLVI
jgi:hypothetical protein